MLVNYHGFLNQVSASYADFASSLQTYVVFYINKENIAMPKSASTKRRIFQKLELPKLDLQ